MMDGIHSHNRPFLLYLLAYFIPAIEKERKTIAGFAYSKINLVIFVQHGKEGFFKIVFVDGPEKWSLATLNTIWTGENFSPIYIINFFEILNSKILSPVLPILPRSSNSCSLFKIITVTHTHKHTYICVYIHKYI